MKLELKQNHICYVMSCDKPAHRFFSFEDDSYIAFCKECADEVGLSGKDGADEITQEEFEVLLVMAF